MLVVLLPMNHCTRRPGRPPAADKPPSKVRHGMASRAWRRASGPHHCVPGARPTWSSCTSVLDLPGCQFWLMSTVLVHVRNTGPRQGKSPGLGPRGELIRRWLGFAWAKTIKLMVCESQPHPRRGTFSAPGTVALGMPKVSPTTPISSQSSCPENLYLQMTWAGVDFSVQARSMSVCASQNHLRIQSLNWLTFM